MLVSFWIRPILFSYYYLLLLLINGFTETRVAGFESQLYWRDTSIRIGYLRISPATGPTSESFEGKHTHRVLPANITRSFALAVQPAPRTATIWNWKSVETTCYRYQRECTSITWPLHPLLSCHNAHVLFFIVSTQQTFSGTLPPDISLLTNLERVYFDHNALSGPVPVLDASVDSLSKLICTNLWQ